MHQSPAAVSVIIRAAVFIASGLVIAAGCTRDGRSSTERSQTGGRPTMTIAAPIDPTIALIRAEGLDRSQVMETLDYLCNVIGPRLTASTQLRTANGWTRDTLEKWGLSNAHLEEWGPFGREWNVRRFSIQVIEPSSFTLIGYPRAWSPGLDAPTTAKIVFLDAQREADLEPFKGKLAGKFVLIGQPRTVEARFAPLAARYDDERLAGMDQASAGQTARDAAPQGETAAERRSRFIAASGAAEALLGASGRRPATQPASQPTTRNDSFAGRLLNFAADENAALILALSTIGDGGTFFVTSAAIPNDPPLSPGEPATRPRVYSVDAPKIPPQVTLAVEDYNRLARGIRRGQSFTAEADLRVEFSADVQPVFNTIAEIPGSDLREQIVMVGAHLDSWHASTGATDNAVGSAAAMEAVRILRALDLHPRRTIRVGLWTGEEQGILGSSAYVKAHFAYREPAATRPAGPTTTFADPATAPEGGIEHATTRTLRRDPSSRPATRALIKRDEYERLSVYFNLDNGTGRIRGIYAQGNAAAVPYFRRWLQPFGDLGASTVTLADTGGTDHLSFDEVGLPGFQFIQDSIEYGTRTHHSNMDVFDRIQAEDMKQASTIMAAFLWEAANMDARFPRKPMTAAGDR